MGSHASGIRDNRERGATADFLSDTARVGSKLSIVSAYFTSSAYVKMRGVLDGVDETRFLFGEPRFLSGVEADSLIPPAFALTDQGLALKAQLRQKATARACAAWIRRRMASRGSM